MLLLRSPVSRLARLAPFVSTFALAPTALAASFYISPAGNDQRNCTNEASDACATFVRCAAVMAPGDTCYAVAGTYTTSGKSGWVLTGKGGTASLRKTFRGAPGQSAVIRPSSYFGEEQEATITIADSALDYVAFSDLTIYGRFRATEALPDCADFVTLERIAFKCPGGIGGGNTTSIMTSNTKDADWTPRQGWVVRDNLFTIDSSCPVYTSPIPDGPDFVHFYGMSETIVENNDFRLDDASRTSTSPHMRFALWFKGRSELSRVRFNYCTGDIGGCFAFNTGKCPNGFVCDTYFVPFSRGDNRAYQNITYMSGSIGWDSNNFCADDLLFNNTAYRPRYDGIAAAPAPGANRSRGNNSIFNNIVVSRVGDRLGGYEGYIRWQSNSDTDGICTQLYLDNNLYYPVDQSKGANFSANEHHARSLADWQAFLRSNCSSADVRESRSRAADPLFVAPEKGDLRLQTGSPARSGGRGGTWATVLGAYVSGNETIGCTFHPSCSANGAPPPPIDERPQKVTGVVRTDAE